MIDIESARKSMRCLRAHRVGCDCSDCTNIDQLSAALDELEAARKETERLRKVLEQVRDIIATGDMGQSVRRFVEHALAQHGEAT